MRGYTISSIFSMLIRVFIFKLSNFFTVFLFFFLFFIVLSPLSPFSFFTSSLCFIPLFFVHVHVCVCVYVRV